MNRYRHIAVTARELNEGLLSWARRLLVEAGLENLEVYGQMPAKGLTSSHLVFFPYRIGPEPKVQENAPGTSLLRPHVALSDPHPFVPTLWLRLGAAMGEAMDALFPQSPDPLNSREGLQFPLTAALPAPLRAWYEGAGDTDEGPWALPSAEGPRARPASLNWRQGLSATARYIVLAHEPGRGTEDRTSASTPLALSALNVILAAVQLERSVLVTAPPLPLPEGFVEYVRALAESVSSPELAGRLAAAAEELVEAVRLEVNIMLIQDLNNRELIALMQALQRPLQTSLNMQVRYTLGSGPIFGPTSRVLLHTRNPVRRAPAREPVA